MAHVKGKDNYDKMPQIEGNDIVPSGGTTGQVLTKDTNANWDYSWSDNQVGINVEDGGVAAPNTPHTTLNFGANLSVTDNGDGSVTINGADNLADLPVCKVRVTTTPFTITPTPAPIAFNTIDVQNDTSVIEQTSSTVITVKETGIYCIHVNLFLNVGSNDDTITITLRKNGVAVPGATTSVLMPDAAATASVTPATFISLNANDQLSLYVNVAAAEPNGSVLVNSQFDVGRYGGIEGPAGQDGADGADGAPGSGSTLIVKDEGVNVANTPHSAFNFVGSGVTVTDGGAGVANISVSGAIVQVTRKNVTTSLTTTVTIPVAATPTIASGVAFDSHSITMQGASNKVRIQALIPCMETNDAAVSVALLFRGSTLIGVASGGNKNAVDHQLIFDVYDTPGAGTHTYSIRVGVTANDGYFNRREIEPNPWGGTAYRNNCNITLTELI